jgi:hypothetical protein
MFTVCSRLTYDLEFAFIYSMREGVRPGSPDRLLTFNHLNVIRDKTHIFLNLQTGVSCLFQNETAGPLRTHEKCNLNIFFELPF